MLDYLGLSITDLGTVQRKTWEARAKWYNIGLELDIDPGTLDTIIGNNDDIDNRFRVMLVTWLKMVNPKPTWEALAEALRSPTVGCEHLAEQVFHGKLVFVVACKVMLYGVCRFQGGTIGTLCVVVAPYPPEKSSPPKKGLISIANANTTTPRCRAL